MAGHTGNWYSHVVVSSFWKGSSIRRLDYAGFHCADIVLLATRTSYMFLDLC